MLSAFKKHPHTYDAVQYAYHVTKGHKPACKEERAACQRFLDDLAGGTEYYLDVSKAEKACRWIEKLPHVKGSKWRNKSLVLEPWEKFFVVNLIGWVDENGLRRFQKCYAKIPRKNGKSILAAAISLFLFCEDGEYGAEVYSGATSEKQALEVFKPAWQMVRKEDALRQKYGLEVSGTVKHPRAIFSEEDAAQFMPLIGDPGDGSSPSVAVVDEYHEHDSDNLVETMETGMGARSQPLLLIITTAGTDYSGPCYMYELECRKLLEGVFEDERTFVIMYGLDEGDDWTTEDALIKANPNYGVSVDAEWLKGQQRAALRNPRKQNAFKRKHLNIWVGAASAWVNMKAWAACADPGMRIEDFSAEDCTMSLDLASRLDLTAKIKLFSREIEGKQHYYVFPTFYLPEETVLEDGNDHYQAWVNAGLIEATEGEEIDFNEIGVDVEQDMAALHVEEVVYDPWRAVQLAQGLAAKGATTVEWRGTPQNMTPAMREVEAAISGKRIHHPDHAVLNWNVSNIVAREGTQETLRPMKESEGNKIDGGVAMIMGIGRAMFRGETEIDYKSGQMFGES